ncbi:uncharacterized protein LOC113356472 [Papaver somniferum]|uniref:uncharacterized protein LOC113356472 n=1 Tax=Papaver somniferum TaxID=3469 RepID=UPI000E70185F|nr:uncharacterized protein LOC113356472 [Papaver somniferum]
MVDSHQLRLIEWDPGFDADKQPTSRATVWVKFPGLPMEFWVEKYLLAMGKSLGTPIVADTRTLNHEHGHFAYFLINIDFARHETDDIHVIAGGRNFLQVRNNGSTNAGKKTSNVVETSDWHEVRHKKNGDKNTTTETFPPFVSSSENLVNKVFTQCKAQIEQGEVSAEECIALKLAKKMEDDLAKLQKAREDMERAKHTYKAFSLRNLTSSGVILSPNKYSVLQKEAILHESKEDTKSIIHNLDSIREGEFENYTDSEVVFSDSNLGLQVKSGFENMDREAPPKVSASSSIQLTKEEHEIFCTITKFDTQQKYLKDLSFRKEYVKETQDQSKRMKTTKKKAKGGGNT